ncbi:glycosyltransferase, group 1 family [Legionella geestiana]|uniref:Glycosyltransferase, group 1 family n=1 Tax=Legionella geestiana TaxID=45065 RepID=A0A0W0U970_9GAMM|nr:glycosyltransferase family 4 protein [Legionella geestiana]KTD04510.1 glycosyltransferase, group 1 family [Legionella geestiana]QBS12279.1 glycosyltransferase WbuB [Legionella geestiana]STX52986.1 glycosyltransferase, group 1 family [Legionella geestiana]
MRILYFHQHYTNTGGGGGTRSYEFARRLVALGHEVTMVCGRYSSGVTGLQGEFHRGRRCGTVDGIDIIELNLPYSNSQGFFTRTLMFLQYSMRAVWIALVHKYDLVFATSTPLTAGIPGIFAKIFRRKPFVFEVRDLWPELPRAMGVITNPLVLKAMSMLEWTSCHAADHCIGLAPGIVEGIKALNIDSSRISMIPNGCDNALFTEDLPSQSPAGINPEDFVGIFAGSHGLANGLDALLDVAKELKRQNASHIKLLFVGDGKIKPALIERAQRESLDNCVFLPTLPKQAIAGLYRRADVGLMVLQNVPAFYYGTSPNKFFDYIASGLAVICNYPGWLSELIQEADCGFSVAPGDAQLFAARLLELAENREKCRLYGRNAAVLAKKFDRDTLAAEFVNVLERVMAASRGGAHVPEMG